MQRSSGGYFLILPEELLKRVSWCAGAAVTKFRQPSGLKSRDVVPASSGGWKSKVTAGSVPVDRCALALPWMLAVCWQRLVLTLISAFSLCASVSWSEFPLFRKIPVIDGGALPTPV